MTISKNVGRKPGSLNKSTIQKRVIKQLERAVLDESLSSEIRTQAALRLAERSPTNG
jgi:hypothetical protein